MVLINETHKYYLMRHRTERQDNTMTEITAKMFEEATGCIPINDDLERCNCPLAGDIGHSTCGWNKNNTPQFYIGPQYSEKTNKEYGAKSEQ